MISQNAIDSHDIPELGGSGLHVFLSFVKRIWLEFLGYRRMGFVRLHWCRPQDMTFRDTFLLVESRLLSSVIFTSSDLHGGTAFVHLYKHLFGLDRRVIAKTFLNIRNVCAHTEPPSCAHRAVESSVTLLEPASRTTVICPNKTSLCRISHRNFTTMPIIVQSASYITCPSAGVEVLGG